MTTADVDAWLDQTIFPKGSEIPGEFKRLEGEGLQRVMRFVDVESVEAARDDLLDVVDLWCSGG